MTGVVICFLFCCLWTYATGHAVVSQAKVGRENLARMRAKNDELQLQLEMIRRNPDSYRN